VYFSSRDRHYTTRFYKPSEISKSHYENLDTAEYLQTFTNGPKMTAPHLNGPPALSTPESHIFEDPTPPVDVSALPKLSDEQLAITYEIERTIGEIREGRWRRIALQFPDEMLVDGPRVYMALRRGLRRERAKVVGGEIGKSETPALEKDMNDLTLGSGGAEIEEERLCILADTSYGACCVDEIAAEHVDAEVVVHYGRSCLSPTARLPVIYVYTSRPIELRSLIEVCKETYPERDRKIILMADIPLSSHIGSIHQTLVEEGYSNVFATSVIHDPSSPLPNRTVPEEVTSDMGKLRDYQVFHLGQPPTALLFTLSSRVGAIHIYDPEAGPTKTKALPASSAMALRRRYAILTSLSTVSIFGILINTLSVKNYLHILEHVKSQIAAAGKKSYTFVVGKINAAKIANFSEIGGWVVIGCWESSLIESKDFFRPIITPFELALTLKGDGERLWTGEWSSDFQAILSGNEDGVLGGIEGVDGTAEEDGNGDGDYDSEEDSAPPEFDLRTGRYISHSRPLRALDGRSSAKAINGKQASSLIKRANGDIAQMGGVVSPGAEFLRSERTWQGLGSDFEVAYEDEGGLVEEGRSGIARGYAVGDPSARR
jgi:diphthamide biosynthesis protein 2